jgi:hypothetical protein
MASQRKVLPRKGLIQPLDGSAWSSDGDANWALLDANVAFMSDLPASAGYVVSAGTGLNVNISAGRIMVGGSLVTYAGGTVTLADNSTNYVFLSPSANYQPTSNTTGFTTGSVPLAQVVTVGGSVSTVTDVRPEFLAQFGLVPANQFLAGPASGIAQFPAPRSLVAADLPVMVGDSGSGGTQGAVPAPAAGDASAGRYLDASGAWSVPGQGGVNTQTGTSYTIASSDNKKLVRFTSASAVSVTLPAASSLGSKFACAIEDSGTGDVTLAPASGTIDGGSTLTIHTNQGLFLYSDGSNWFTMRGSAGAGGVPNFADAEVPAGPAGTTFTLAHAPNPAASLILVWDGLVRKAGVDYTLAGSTITTYTSVNPVGSNLQAWYRY